MSYPKEMLDLMLKEQQEDIRKRAQVLNKAPYANSIGLTAEQIEDRLVEQGCLCVVCQKELDKGQWVLTPEGAIACRRCPSKRIR